jgi:hypothetical protein
VAAAAGRALACLPAGLPLPPVVWPGSKQAKQAVGKATARAVRAAISLPHLPVQSSTNLLF